MAMADDTQGAQTTAAPAVPNADAAPPVPSLLTDGPKAADAGDATTTDGSKPDADKPDGDAKPKAGDADAKNGAPESYGDFEVPDGVEIDTEALAAVQPIFKELGLSKEQAQKVVSFEAARVQKTIEAQNQMIEGWAKSTQEDKELNAGPGFEKNLMSAHQTYLRVASPELRSLLDSTGLGNHPELVKMFVKIGKATGEDSTPPVSDDPSRGARSIEERLYGVKK